MLDRAVQGREAVDYGPEHGIAVLKTLELRSRSRDEPKVRQETFTLLPQLETVTDGRSRRGPKRFLVKIDVHPPARVASPCGLAPEVTAKVQLQTIKPDMML